MPQNFPSPLQQRKMGLIHSFQKKGEKIIPGPARTRYDDGRRCCVSSAWVWAGKFKVKGKFRIILSRIGSKIKWGSSPAPPGGRSAGGEPLGRSPGCGCWGQLLCSAAVSGSPPGGGYYGDQLPCAKLCGREPEAQWDRSTWVKYVDDPGYTEEQV